MLRKKTFTLDVVQNTITTQEFDVPREINTIVGVTICGDREDLVYARAAVEVSIAGTDIIKTGERATQYMYGIDNPVRMWAFGELPLKNEDRRLRVRVQDQDTPAATFSAYKLEVILTYRAES